MKTLAIALATTNNEKITPDQKSFLKEINMDKRLKKAESIKAYLESIAYREKNVLYQVNHAEFGRIHSLAAYDGNEDGIARSASGEKGSLDLLWMRLVGVERLILFDADFTIPYILKRSMILGHEPSVRFKLHSTFGTATTAIIDIKRLWSGSSKEYASMTLKDLCLYLGEKKEDFPSGDLEAQAAKIFYIYEKMKEYLVRKKKRLLIY